LTLHCVGCGSIIPWDGKGLFAYTCICGGTVFADDMGRMYFPASLIIDLYEGKELAHIDYYVGISNHMSREKQELIEFLKANGATWSWECPQCRGKIVKHIALQVKLKLIRFQLHPELKKLVEEEIRRSE